MIRPQVGTNKVITSQGINEQTIITSFNDIKDDALFKLTSDFNGPNNYQGLSVNKVFTNQITSPYSPAYQDVNSATWQFYTAGYVPTRNIFLSIGYTALVRENIAPGMLDNGTAPTVAAYADVSENFLNWSVPFKALSRAFNKIDIELGNSISVISSFEREPFGIGVNFNENKVALGHPDEIYKYITGDSVSYGNIGNMNSATMNVGKWLRGDINRQTGGKFALNDFKNESTFLEFFEDLLCPIPISASGTPAVLNLPPNCGIKNGRLNIPLSWVCPLFEGDFYLPPGVKFKVIMELPIIDPTDANKLNSIGASNFAAWKDVGNFNILALEMSEGSPTYKRTIDYYNNSYKKLTNLKLGEFGKGLAITFNLKTIPPYITIVHYNLQPEIADRLARDLIERPMVLNNEFLTTYYESWTPDNTDYMFQHKPNVCLPQEIYFGIVNQSVNRAVAGDYVYSGTYPVNTRTNLLKNNFINGTFVFSKDWLPLLIKKFEVTMGIYPFKKIEPRNYKTFNRKPVAVGDVLYSPQGFFTNSNLGTDPETVIENRKLQASYVLRNNNISAQNQYSEGNTNIAFGDHSPECRGFFKFSMLPEKQDRGEIVSDMAEHVLQFNIQFDTDSPYWQSFVAMCGPDTKIVIIRKQFQQVSFRADGSVTIIQWPGLMIEGNRAGQTTQVVGNLPNGSFQ